MERDAERVKMVNALRRIELRGRDDGYRWDVHPVTMAFRLVYDEPCIDDPSGPDVPQFGRWWMLSSDMTEESVIKTAFMAIEASNGHRLREQFHVDGVRVFGPHIPLSHMADAARRPR